MNNTFLSIVSDRLRTQTMCNETMSCNIKTRSANECDDTSQYIKVHPGNIGYVDNMRDYLDKTKTALCRFNNKCIDKYKDAIKSINPIGLEVPKIDKNPDDNEIKDYYKNLRVVLLDKFQELSKLEEGGEGWIKFIDTLATPEEKARNYEVPKFDTIYTQFVSDKKVSKVSREDLAEAVETLYNYDDQMKRIIEDADTYCEERDKSVYLYNEKASAYTFEESASCLAEAMLIIETDFLQAQELEVRNKALIESVKNAHRILFGLYTHNPRDIRESSLTREWNISFIEEKIDNIVEDPDNNIKEKSVQESRIDNVVETIKEKSVLSNKIFLDKYEEAASKSNAIGIHLKEWYTPINIDESFDTAITIINSTLDHTTLADKSVEKLESLCNSAVCMEKAIDNGVLNEEVSSPSIGKSIEILPCINNNNNDKWFFNTEKNYSITKEDIKESILYLKDAHKDIDVLFEESKCVSKKEKKDKLPDNKVSKKERLLNKIGDTRKNIVSKLKDKKVSAKYEQFKFIQTQSRVAILNAARVIKESTILKERNEMTEFIDNIDKLEESVKYILESDNVE